MRLNRRKKLKRCAFDQCFFFENGLLNSGVRRLHVLRPRSRKLLLQMPPKKPDDSNVQQRKLLMLRSQVVQLIIS